MCLFNLFCKSFFSVKIEEYIISYLIISSISCRFTCNCVDFPLWGIWGSRQTVYVVQTFSCGRLMHAGLNFVTFFYSFQESTRCSPQYESVYESIRIRLEEPYNRAQNYMLHVILNQYFYQVLSIIKCHKFNNFTLSTVCKDHKRPALFVEQHRQFWALINRMEWYIL